MTHYLLTGATGVVGSAVLKRLLEKGCHVTLPIRAETPEMLARRITRLLDFINPAPRARERLFPVRADLLKPDLGMPRQTYDWVTGRITHIIHCAGNVRMTLDPGQAREQTLAMTRNMLALMQAGPNIRKMEYISTVGVAGHTPGEIPETWLCHARTFRNSYEDAKSRAEELIREKIAQGLNITVHRPSMVVGDSRTGRVIRFQVFYYLCEFLSGALTRGWLPDLSGHHLDIVPSDHVADLICWSSEREAGLPPVLHASSGRNGSIRLDDLGNHVREKFRAQGRKLPTPRQLPVPLFTIAAAALKSLAPAAAKRQLSTLPVFLAYLATPQFFANDRTTELAGRDGIVLPRYLDYLEKVMEFYLNLKKKKA